MPVLPKPNESNFAPAPNGPHPAACFRIIDLGTQDGSYKGKATRKRKLMISWELFTEETMTDGRPFIVSKTFTWSMSEKAGLRQMLESWRGKAFEDADFDQKGGFQIQSILGKPCLLNIKHETAQDGSGKVYANIDSITRLPKGMTVGGPTNPMTFVWLSHDEFDARAFESLSDRLKETIQKAPEYRQAVTGEAETGEDPQQADQTNGHDDPSDEIPF